MGLRLKLILPFLSAIVLITLFSHAYLLPHLVNEEVLAKQKSEQEYLDMLGVSLTPDLLSKDLANVYATLSKIKDREGWIGLELWSENNIRIFPLSAGVQQGDILLKYKMHYHDTDLGLLQVGLDSHLIFEHIKEKYRIIEIVFIGLFGGSIFIASFIIHRFAILPIERLSETSERLAKGDFCLDLPKTGKDEVGKLVNAYKTMVDELLHREIALKAETAKKEELLDKTKSSLQVSEAELIKNKAQWGMVSQIVNSSPIATFVIDNDHRITHWNTSLEKLSGKSVMAMVGSRDAWKAFYDNERPTMADLIVNKDFDRLAELYKTKHLGGNKELNIWHAEDFFNRLANGGKWLEFSAAPIYNSDNEVIGAIETLRDVTNERVLQNELEERVLTRTQELNNSKKKLEETINLLKMTQNELIEAEKMSSLASLVGGVAHEVNTPLGICITASTHQSENRETLLEKIAEQKLKKSDLDTFLNQCSETDNILNINLKRAAELIRSFKQVAVDQNSEEERSINLKGYVQEVLTSLHPKIKKTNVEVISNIPDNINLDTFPGAISQVITNLVMNSLIHAFPDQQGQITIEADYDGDLIQLLFSDDGIGMDDLTLKKIFEPFYTTKRNSGGSGLGMHIVYNLVTHQLKGSIKCISSKGNGTQFIISFKSAMREVAE